MKLNIKTKIILAVLIPLLALFYFTTIGVTEKYQLMSEVRDLETLSNLSIKISSYIHEIQKERGATGLFMGSDGVKFISELKDQRILTDIKRQDLSDFLIDFESDKFGREFKQTLGIAVNKMKKLNDWRNLVNAQSISDREVIDFYTGHNALMLDVIHFISRTSSNAKITTLTTAYVNLLEGKEKAGIERAIGSNTFAADEFAPGNFEYFNFLINSQDTFFDVFFSFATLEQALLFEELMGRPVVAEVQRMRNIAILKFTEGDFGVNAGYWFNTMTTKIDLLKKVEDKISNDLHLSANNISKEAQNDLLLFLIIAFAAVFLTIVLSVSLLPRIKSVK